MKLEHGVGWTKIFWLDSDRPTEQDKATLAAALCVAPAQGTSGFASRLDAHAEQEGTGYLAKVDADLMRQAADHIRHLEGQLSLRAPLAEVVPSNDSLADKLQATYNKVREWPERSATGFMDLLELRNLVPDAIEAIRSQSPAENDRQLPPKIPGSKQPNPLMTIVFNPPERAANDDLDDLVSRFSKALLAKLKLGRANGRSGWEQDDWEEHCQQGLLRHVEKGDPRDVAAYCAFMWHHGWATKASCPSQPGAEKKYEDRAEVHPEADRMRRLAYDIRQADLQRLAQLTWSDKDLLVKALNIAAATLSPQDRNDVAGPILHEERNEV